MSPVALGILSTSLSSGLCRFVSLNYLQEPDLHCSLTTDRNILRQPIQSANAGKLAVQLNSAALGTHGQSTRAGGKCNLIKIIQGTWLLECAQGKFRGTCLSLGKHPLLSSFSFAGNIGDKLLWYVPVTWAPMSITKAFLS